MLIIFLNKSTYNLYPILLLLKYTDSRNFQLNGDKKVRGSLGYFYDY